jgi:putative ABC transport system substrate-binding protein
MSGMGGREFVTLLGGAAATWPLAARAQQPKLPVIGFLRSFAPLSHFVAAFQQGLKEEAFVEGQNVVVEYRSADNQLDRLPGLAEDFVQRQVAVIVGNTPSIDAAKAATQVIPIVFVTARTR